MKLPFFRQGCQMESQVQNLFSTFVSIETKLSDIYMALAAVTDEGQFAKIFDKAYYEAVEHKHHFIDLRRMVRSETDLFSEELLIDAQLIERQLLTLTKNARNLEQSLAFHNLADLVIEVETRLCKLYSLICNEAWEKEQLYISSILAKKEVRLSEMLSIKSAKSSDKHP